MNKEKINIINYIERVTGKTVEFQKYNEVDFLMFDFLPFELREAIFQTKEFDSTNMILIPRECQCGEAHFYNAQHFFDICKNNQIFNKLKQ